MRIESIETSNFKSLVNFRLELDHFSCLIGLNGAGKSTVLQLIDFLARQVRGDVRGWVEQRGWLGTDVLSQLSPRQTLSFKVTASGSQSQKFSWTGDYDPSRFQCTRERITTADAELSVHDGGYSLKERNSPRKHVKRKVSGLIPFMYEGSILSGLRDEVLPKSLIRFKNFLLKTESLDMLTPDRLRQRTRDANGSLGHGGRQLSAFVFELGGKGRQALTNKLKPAYRQLRRVHSKPLRSGWKQLRISEVFGDKKLITDAPHVNDGMLRLMAIQSELASHNKFLLFDEIENGINPELVEFVTDELVHAKQQVLVTTHSPMILNFLDDQMARKAVVYLYKTREGHSRSIPFFSIPSLAEKLKFMGPGEAFADTDLTALADEITQITAEG